MMLPSDSKSRKAIFESIQVIEVNRRNFNQIWPYLLVSLKQADLLAIDLELSGLGTRSGIRARTVDDRYTALRDAARTRSILSIGLSLFRKISQNEKKKRIQYSCQVFNILTLCSSPFTIEPDCMEFLAKHKFDFNKLINDGVQYYPITLDKACPLRSLFQEIFAVGPAIALHNGWMDMCFIYQHFYGALPEKLPDFLADLSELFPPESPLVDSKYLAEFVTRMKASFLEYVFRKCQRDNVIECGGDKVYLKIEFADQSNVLDVIKAATDEVDCSLPQNFPRHVIPCDLKANVCDRYVNHGYCHQKSKCEKLHDVDFALDIEMKRTEKEREKRKRRYSHVFPDNMKEENLASTESGDEVKEAITIKQMTNRTERIAVHGTHRAGVDAFMTGFAVLFQNRMSIFRKNCLDPAQVSRLCLSGKDIPLIIQNSQFANCSEMHQKKIVHVRAARERNRKLRAPEEIAQS